MRSWIGQASTSRSTDGRSISDRSSGHSVRGEKVRVRCTTFASFHLLSSMLISASEGYSTERALSETGLLPRLDALHVPDANQAGAEVFAEVGLAADADSAGEEGLGVEAGRDVEIGDRRALAANQGEDPVAVDLAG